MNVQSVERLKLDATSGGSQGKTRGVWNHRLSVSNDKFTAVLNNRMFLVFSPAVEKLEIVECDLEKPYQIGPALGNASTVICTIGASEKEVFDITGPFRIDYQATKNLIDAGN